FTSPSTSFPYTTLFRSLTEGIRQTRAIEHDIDPRAADKRGSLWSGRLTARYARASGVRRNRRRNYSSSPLRSGTMARRNGRLFRSEEHTSELQSQSNLV